MKEIIICTYSTCLNDQGPGGWASILIFNKKNKELSGFMPSTTVNRLELTSIISGLGALKEPCKVSIYTTSDYIIDNVNKKQYNSSKLENEDLWSLYNLQVKIKKHDITYKKVSRKSNNKIIQRCAELAEEAISEYRRLNTNIENEG